MHVKIRAARAITCGCRRQLLGGAHSLQAASGCLKWVDAWGSLRCSY